MPTGDPPIKRQCLYQRRIHRTDTGEIMQQRGRPHGGTRDRLRVLHPPAERLSASALRGLFPAVSVIGAWMNWCVRVVKHAIEKNAEHYSDNGIRGVLA